MQLLIGQVDNPSIESRKIRFIYGTEEISYSAFNEVIYRNASLPQSLKRGRQIGTRDPVDLIYTLLLAWFHSDHVHAQCQGKLLIAGTISLPTPSCFINTQLSSAFCNYLFFNLNFSLELKSPIN
jgi:hypothetical protein